MFSNWPPPEMERLGPLGMVPILETDDGTLIRSSLAIPHLTAWYLSAGAMLPGAAGVTAGTSAHRALVSG